MSINRIREIDDKLSQVVADVHLQIPDAMKGMPFETTASVLNSLVNSLASLKAGILYLAEAGNLYCTFVLFRAFLEHLLKTLAIFLKALDDESDEFAEHYLRLRIKETFDYLRSCEQAGLLIGDKPKSVLDQWIPEAQALSANKVKELEKPFRYRNLIHTIRELTDTNSPDYLSKIIPNYSELSGFVHGGPTSHDKLDVIHTEGLGESELYHIADLSISMFYSAQRWLLILASTVQPEEFEQHYKRLEEALNTLKENEQSRDPIGDSL